MENKKDLPPVRLELTAFRLWDWRAAYCATEACEENSMYCRKNFILESGCCQAVNFFSNVNFVKKESPWRKLGKSLQFTTTQSCQAILRQLSGNHQTVVRQSSGSHQTVILLLIPFSALLVLWKKKVHGENWVKVCNLPQHKVVRQLSGNCLAIVRQLSGYHQAVIKLLFY